MAFIFTHHIFFLMGPAHPIPTLHSHLAILTAQTATPGRNLVKNKTNLKEHEQMKGKKEKCAWRNLALTDFGAIIFAWLRWDLIIFRIMQLLMGRPGRAEVCSMLFS